MIVVDGDASDKVVALLAVLMLTGEQAVLIARMLVSSLHLQNAVDRRSRLPLVLH